MVGLPWRWVVVVLAAVLGGFAVLGLAAPGEARAHVEGGAALTVTGADVVEIAAPSPRGGDAFARSLMRFTRPLAVPADEGESRLAALVVAAVVAGWWVLVRGDGWGARPVAGWPLATRRGPPA